MKLQAIASAVAVFAFSGVATADAPKKKPEAKTEAKADPGAAMMAAMAKYATPGDNHKKLEQWMVGSWNAAVKMYMSPDGKATESAGTAEVKSILGGRFLTESYKSTMMGQPFEGQNTFGYDLAKQKFTSVWVDTMGTSLTLTEGTLDPSGKVMTMTGDSFDPTVGKSVPLKTVTKFESDKKHVMEMYGQMNGKEVKMMEITYTRK